MADSFGLGNPPIPMSVLFILIAVSLVFASGFLLAFIWAMNDRQFEDDHTPAVRMLFDALPSKGKAERGKRKEESGNMKVGQAGETGTPVPHPSPRNLQSTFYNRYSAINQTSPDPSLSGEEIRGQALSPLAPRPLSPVP